jgi:UDP-N-acetylglucosamine 1-carboxyvinyltransferase
MDRIIIDGGVPLRGTVEISGAKNAALPLMAACLLTDEPLALDNVPDLADIGSMQRLLQALGGSATHPAGRGDRIVLHAPEILNFTAPYDLVRRMRASVLVMGPLVARAGEATVSLPAAAPSGRGRSTCT